MSEQMSEEMSVTSRTVERDLDALQKMGLLRREGATKKGRWIIVEQPGK